MSVDMKFTPREALILQLMAEGKTDQQIAKEIPVCFGLNPVKMLPKYKEKIARKIRFYRSRKDLEVKHV